MFHNEEQKVEKIIHSYCKTHNLPTPEELQWNPIPFSGEWGISTSFFRLAANEARKQKQENKTPKPVSIRAQEIATEIAGELENFEEFSHVESKNGYLNLFFSTRDYSYRIINTITKEREHFGYGKRNNQKIMVEFSQPNTHKAFHVGHLDEVYSEPYRSWRAYYGIRNRWLTIVSNETWAGLVDNLPGYIRYEVQSLVYVLRTGLVRPYWKALFDIAKSVRYIKAKRRHLQSASLMQFKA